MQSRCVPIVDGDLWGVEVLDQTTYELEYLLFLVFGEQVGEFGLQELCA